MKIFNNSILFYRYNLKSDTISTYFFFKINLLCWRFQNIDFDLKVLNAKQVVSFYKDLDKDWNDKYKF